MIFFVQLDVNEDTLVVSPVYFINVPPNGHGGDDARDALDIILRMIQLGDVHKGGNDILGSGGHSDRVQSAGKEVTLNLHDLGVDLAAYVIATLQVYILGIEGLEIGQILDVLVKIASPGGGDDGVDDCRPSSLISRKP